LKHVAAKNMAVVEENRKNFEKHLHIEKKQKNGMIQLPIKIKFGPLQK